MYGYSTPARRAGKNNASPRRVRDSEYERNKALRNLMLNRRSLRASRPFWGASRALVASRVHAFKRVGTGFTVQSVFGNSLPPVIAGAATSTAAGLTLGNLITGPVANSVSFGGAFSFSLAQLANVTELTSLFDNYRIKKVVLKFMLSSDNANMPTGSGASTVYSNAPIIHYTYDPDDSSIPTNETSIMQNSYCKSVRLTDMFTIALTPRAQSTITANPSASTTTGGLLSTSQWLDCDNPNVFHYGLKMYVSGWPSQLADNALSLRVIPTFYVEGKNVV